MPVSPRVPDGRGPTAWPAFALAGAALILGLAVLAGAFAGQWEIEERFNLGFQLFPTQQTTPQDQADELSPPPRERPDYDFGWLGWVMFALMLGMLVLAGWWLINRASRIRIDIADPPVAPWGSDSVAGEPELPVLRRGVDDALGLIESIADPSDAVIAAWIAIEDAAARSGAPRRPAQTPTEFTVTVLSATRADPGAISGMLGLYHLARFSDHPIAQPEVAAAMSHLERLAASWDAVVLEPVLRASAK